MRRVRVLLVGLLLVVGCSKSPIDDTEVVLVRGLSAEPESLHPHTAGSVAALKLLGDLYEGLLTRDAAGQLSPGNAIDWQLSPDQLTYTFRLRDHLRWSDGSPLQASDYVVAWQQRISAAQPSIHATLLAPVARRAGGEQLDVSAPDATTLVVQLSSPAPDFLQRLAHPSLAPVALDMRLSNGAYRLLEQQPGGRITLGANPYFHAADELRIDRVVYQSFEQEQTENAAFVTGAVDITSRVPRELFRAGRPDDVRVAPYLGVVFLSFNMRDPLPLALRRQLSAAVDREALATQVVGRGEQPAYSLVPPGALLGDVAYASLSDELAQPALPPLVAQATDVSDVGSLSLHYATSDENRVVAAALQAMWREALPELQVVLENKEFRVLLAAARRGDFDGLVRASWIADYNDASQFLEILRSDSPLNSSGFNDQRLDTLLDAVRASEDSERRATTLRAAERLITEQVPVIPLYFFVSKHRVSECVLGWQDNPLDLHYSRYLGLCTESAER